MKIPYCPLIALPLLVAVGCEQELDQAFENVRAAAPAICKDYCEEKCSCEWPKADGPKEDAAFSSKIRQCTVACAWYMAEGAYVFEYTAPIDKTYYVDKLSGGAMEDMLACVYDSGSYHCASNEDGPDEYLFEPRLDSQCSKVALCANDLAIDFTFNWNDSGADGVCEPVGEQRIEIPFF